MDENITKDTGSFTINAHQKNALTMITKKNSFAPKKKAPLYLHHHLIIKYARDPKGKWDLKCEKIFSCLLTFFYCMYNSEHLNTIYFHFPIKTLPIITKFYHIVHAGLHSLIVISSACWCFSTISPLYASHKLAAFAKLTLNPHPLMDYRIRLYNF